MCIIILCLKAKLMSDWYTYSTDAQHEYLLKNENDKKYTIMALILKAEASQALNKERF
jgi:hypothetical protein